MELIVRGLMALALIDCPEPATECPNGAAILIPDTSYFEKLGLHEHSAMLSIPLAWIDTEHGRASGFEVVTVGDERMAVFALSPGEHFVLGNPKDLVVRPVRGEPVLRSSDSASFPVSQLVSANELIESPEVDFSTVRNVIWIRTGSIAARTLYGSAVVGAGNEPDLRFEARGANKFRPRPLATEVVVSLLGSDLKVEEAPPAIELERYGTIGEPAFSAWLLRRPPTAARPETAYLSHLPKDPVSRPSADQMALTRMMTRASLQSWRHEQLFAPIEPKLLESWDNGCPRCVPWNAWLCPMRLLMIDDDCVQMRAQYLTSGTAPPGDCPGSLVRNAKETACVPHGFEDAPVVGNGCPLGLVDITAFANRIDHPSALLAVNPTSSSCSFLPVCVELPKF